MPLPRRSAFLLAATLAAATACASSQTPATDGGPRGSGGTVDSIPTPGQPAGVPGAPQPQPGSPPGTTPSSPPGASPGTTPATPPAR